MESKNFSKSEIETLKEVYPDLQQYNDMIINFIGKDYVELHTVFNDYIMEKTTKEAYLLLLQHLVNTIPNTKVVNVNPDPMAIKLLETLGKMLGYLEKNEK